MADRMPAEIMIGGPVAAHLVPNLIAAIHAEEPFAITEQGEGPIEATSPEELVALARQTDPSGVLRLVNYDAAYGGMPCLEEFLVKHEISFDCWSEAKYEHDGCVVRFRPGMKEPRMDYATQGQERVVPADPLEEARHALRQNQPKKALELLEEALGPEIAPLEPLQVVDRMVSRDACGRTLGGLA